jgi:7-keto-8-aminopelargonate synthetase-like enzyme
LLYCQPIGEGTNLSAALTHLNRTVKRRSVVFVVSDFQDENYEKALRIAKRKHDIIPVVIGDQREMEMPSVGMIELKDSETGLVTQFDTASRRNRELFADRARARINEQDNLFRRLKIEPIRIMTGQDYVDPIREYFHRRGAKK